MVRASIKAEDVIRERKAAAERELESRMKRDRQTLERGIEQFAEFFNTTTRKALERLERNGYPGGELIKFSDEEELAAWQLEERVTQFGRYGKGLSYFLASDGSIRENYWKSYGDYTWRTISPASLRRDALEDFESSKSLEVAACQLTRWEPFLERCSLICPD